MTHKAGIPVPVVVALLAGVALAQPPSVMQQPAFNYCKERDLQRNAPLGGKQYPLEIPFGEDFRLHGRRPGPWWKRSQVRLIAWLPSAGRF